MHTLDAAAMGFEVIDWSHVPAEATPPATPLSSVAEPNTTTTTVSTSETSESGLPAPQSAETTPTGSNAFVVVNSTTVSTSATSERTSVEATPTAPRPSIVAENTPTTSATSQPGSSSGQSAEATPSAPPLAFVIIDHSDVPAASILAATDSDSDFEELPEGWEERVVSFLASKLFTSCYLVESMSFDCWPLAYAVV